MNCPFCNGEMEHGFVTSGAALTWRKRKKKITFNPYPDKKQGEFVFSYNPFGGAAAEGYICKNCKKIVIGYEEEIE